MSIRLAGSSSGYTELDAGAVAGNNTLKMPTNNGTAYQIIRNGATAGTTEFADKIVSGTAMASTSGTSIDFTGIPSWVKRVTVMFSGVSSSGTSIVQVQVGAGSFVTTGYTGSVEDMNPANATGGAALSSGIFTTTSANANASATRYGVVRLQTLGSNIWVFDGMLSVSNSTFFHMVAGGITLSGTLDRIRITTVNGTDTFDAGTINILYE